MFIKLLSAFTYEDTSKNNGDCIIIDTGTELVIYDCGCVEHANRVINYMKDKKYKTAKFILSHNDSDHFDGLTTLIDSGVISKVYTLLLLKYKVEIRKLIGDKNVSDESLTKKIKELYDNIYSLSGKVELIDALTLPSICTGLKMVGPEKNAAIAAVAKFLDDSQGDTLDGETIYNAICFQVRVTMDNDKYFLLCGDSSYVMIEDNLRIATYIQLPHHGKYEIAKQIFELKDKEKNVNIRYYVSDNTGDSNGGSDELKKNSSGHHVEYTNKGDIEISTSSINTSPYIPGKSYGWYIK